MAWSGSLPPISPSSACAQTNSQASGAASADNPVGLERSGELTAATTPSSGSLILKFGFGGIYKLGHPCAITIRVPDVVTKKYANRSSFSNVLNESYEGDSGNQRLATQDAPDTGDQDAQGNSTAQEIGSVEITTVDGDAVEVVYRHRATMGQLSDMADDGQPAIVVPIRIGRANSILSARWIDSQQLEVAREDRVLDEANGLSPTQPLVLNIGNSLGVEDLIRTSADGSAKSVSVLNVTRAADLPQSHLEYSPVDLLVISTADLGLLRAIRPAQWQAIDDYIRRGGGCILSLGTTADELRSFPRLMNWLPGPLQGEGSIRQPAPLESLVSTDQPVQPFPALILHANRGSNRLTLTDALGKSTSWWVSMPHGFGTIQIIASDLGHASFSQWKHRRLLWERLASDYFEKSELESVKASGGSNVDSYLGYNDLTGQLRATLEQFPGVPVVSFSQVAAVVVGLMILLGPVDYLISVRWLKRPHLSWPIAAGILLVSCLGLTWVYHLLRPDQILINTARIIDLDAQSGRLDGHQWSHVYSAKARKVEVSARTTFTDSPIRLDWQGLPGSGLGGLQSAMQFEQGMPTYHIDVDKDGGSRILDVGIPAAGTKSVYATWTEQLPGISGSGTSMPKEHPAGIGLAVEGSATLLQELPNVDQLEGVIVNPLNVDLRDAALYYHRWHYALKSRMPAGDRVTLSAQMIPRDVSRRLNRQQEKDGKLTTARWDPADRGQLDRLLELMMFHKAATGRNYTSLTHRYQPYVDHSNLLNTNYAILVGRLDSPPTELQVAAKYILNDPDSQIPIQAVTDRTWVRIMLPVGTQNSQNRNR